MLHGLLCFAWYMFCAYKEKYTSGILIPWVHVSTLLLNYGQTSVEMMFCTLLVCRLTFEESNAILCHTRMPYCHTPLFHNKLSVCCHAVSVVVD